MAEVDLLGQQYAMREELASSLEEDLVGYASDYEVIDDAPATRYIAGILFAPELRVDELIDQIVEANEEGQAPDPTPNDSDGRYPSSMGLTCAVQDGSADALIVEVDAARYVPIDVDGNPLDVARHDRDELLGSKWRRAPLELPRVNIAISEPDERPYEVDAGLQLWVRVREPDARGRVPITVVLRNTTAKTSENELRDLSAFFQVKLAVTAEDDADVFVDRTGEIASVGDEDMETQQLLYRHARSFATGHGCSVNWTKSSTMSESATRLETTFVPTVEVRTSVSNPEIENPALSMEFCETAGTAQLIEALNDFVTDYETWITSIGDQAKTLDSRYDVAAARNINNCEEICARLRSSVDHLETDSSSRRAFRAANASMRVQRARSEWRKSPKEDRGDLAQHMTSSWRPFQLGFLLLSLRGVADPSSGERDIADLLWFPTGGGKTEAYLGLIAFTLFRRRLANDSSSAAGTTVIMRYTLRLLTLQQFERAATLICACEQIRRENAAEFGDADISIGLWVGEAATPNTLDDAEEALKQIRAGKTPQTKNPVQLAKCPWCGGRLNWGVAKSPRELRITCKEPTCEFSDGLPIKVVDEDIYNKPTSLLIATADKFAQMTWNARTATLFGLESGTKPPELIIQDELHLISGPLGTLAALYETVVDRVCTAAGVRPKVIASTATIRRAESQTEGLFDRRMMQFPPPGIDARDSYFAVEADPSAQASRLYAGVMSTTASQTTSLVRTYSELLAAVEDSAVDDDVRDPYWTLLGYFNSLRILGGAMLQVQDDVTARMKQLRGGEDTTRPMEIQEMTSRVESGKIPELLDRLATSHPDPDALDVVLATNMISVGVDVDRLGLMVVMGQPQGTAEYIQATSRVGRRHPGLVVTIFNSRKSRDRSHFENFRTYHEALYRQVESTSVTPFASRARQRGAHAVLVALLRQTVPGLRADDAAGSIRDFDEDVEIAVDQILTRVESVDPQEVDNTRRELAKFVAEWREMAEKSGLVYRQNRGTKHALLKDAADDVGSAFPTLNSLRDVDSECSLSATVTPIGSIRRTQMISTYGVGSMVPLDDESFIVMGLDMWIKGPRVPEARLEQSLGVELAAPPAGENAPTIPVQRFPRWYSCASCGYLGTHSRIQADGECKSCRRESKFIPSRFVVACEHGHLQDFPYSRWVHGNRGSTDDCKLTLTFSGASASLRDIVVTCETCRISRTLDGIFDAAEISKVAPRCLGQSPWLRGSDGAGCDQSLRTLQRGASNVWFPDTRSALSIPPWSEEAMLIATRSWSYLPPDHPEQWESILRTQATSTVTVDQLVQATAHLKRAEEGERPSIESLRVDEYMALKRGTDGEGVGNEFVATVEAMPAALSDHFEDLVLAHRLREVRVLIGFSRLNSPPVAGQGNQALATLCRDEVGWRPAVEVRGEGVFLTLNEDRLNRWERRPDVMQRAAMLQKNAAISHAAYGGTGEPSEVTPRALLLHSLAHALIDSLSLDAGYPASSLRERLYASDDMCGLLIYTASSDSAGSLGGVVRQAGPKQIERLVRDAVERSSWCSADPVCSESDPHGVDGLNLAACHNCLLLPETSCEERNTLLDRTMLVGSPAERSLGYFSDWI